MKKSRIVSALLPAGQKKNPAGAGGVGGNAPAGGAGTHRHCTPNPAPRQAPVEAVHGLARLLAGASDVDLDALRQYFPDFPGGDRRPDLNAVREWLNERPDLAREVLATNPDSPPPGYGPKVRWTVGELLATQFPEPRWIIPGLIPEGLTIFAGRPKLGKSWFALQVACAVATGGMVFGQKVEQGRVLFLALEDSPRRLQARIRQQMWPSIPPDALVFYTDWPDLAQSGGLAELCNAIHQENYTLVVVDTLSRAARFDQHDVSESTAVLGNLQRVASDYHRAILLIDHYRKSVGLVSDLVDDVLGSTGKAAAPDTVIGLVRERGKRGATLRVTGRDVEERDLAIEWDPTTCSWHLLGDAQEVARSQGKQEVLEALEQLGGEATVKEISEHLGKNKGQVSKILASLACEGRVIKGERQGKEVPYRLPRPDPEDID